MLDADEVALLAGRVQERCVDDGQVLVAEGRAPDAAYVVLEGSLLVSYRGRDLASLGAGAVIGGAASQPGPPRLVTVRATSRTRLLVIPLAGAAEETDADIARDRGVCSTRSG
jgi:CRP-like cAMP-binding protein